MKSIMVAEEGLNWTLIIILFLIGLAVIFGLAPKFAGTVAALTGS